MEGLRCSALPLVCERIFEVQYRDWLVGPSLKKDGTFNKRKAPHEDDEDEPSEDTEGEFFRNMVFPLMLTVFIFSFSTSNKSDSALLILHKNLNISMNHSWSELC